jgi:TolB protein
MRVGGWLASGFLWAVPLLAQQLPIHSSAPSASPDGARIAFQAERDGGTQIFVIRTDGTREVQLTQGRAQRGRPRWSADGKRVMVPVFANDTSRLFALDPEGRGSELVAVVPGRNPILLRDGSVLFSTGGWTTMQLAVAGRDGANPRRLSDGEGAIWNAALSPDGRQVAYTRSLPRQPLSVWVMNVDGTAPHRVTNFPLSDGQPQLPAWSPDGLRLAVQAAVRSPVDTARQIGHIWVVELATGKAIKLSPHNEAYLDEIPEWLPDGKRIAFQSDRSGRMEIWVMNADGTGARLLSAYSRQP